MPHAERSTTDASGRRTCPYCGYPLARPTQRTCRAHADLPAREPLDDRYVTSVDDD